MKTFLSFLGWLVGTIAFMAMAILLLATVFVLQRSLSAFALTKLFPLFGAGIFIWVYATTAVTRWRWKPSWFGLLLFAALAVGLPWLLQQGILWGGVSDLGVVALFYGLVLPVSFIPARLIGLQNT